MFFEMFFAVLSVAVSACFVSLSANPGCIGFVEKVLFFPFGSFFLFAGNVEFDKCMSWSLGVVKCCVVVVVLFDCCLSCSSSVVVYVEVWVVGMWGCGATSFR